jgi:hypothetical protein
MMPAQQPPYTQTLSLLRKIDLIRLSLEFKLPTDGSVVNLRDRLRVYLNAHRDVIYRNPRYKPLFPKLRRPPQPRVASVAESRSISYRTPSPVGSEHSNASTQSYKSWNGIEVHPHQHIPHVPVSCFFFLFTIFPSARAHIRCICTLSLFPFPHSIVVFSVITPLIPPSFS